MDKIKLTDIDLSKLEISKNQGTKSTIYIQDNLCIKILDKYLQKEKEILLKKTLEMDGLFIENVLLPKSIIIENEKLEGYVMNNFKNSIPLNDYFGTYRYVNCKEFFNVIKKASIILKEIHKTDIICQDISFDNILIDKYGNIKYCDIVDSCTYKNYNSPFISLLLNEFITNYRKEKYYIPSKNMDRVSFMLSFYYLIYLEQLQKISKKKYHSLSDNINTLEITRKYANILVDKKSKIPEIPYMDELIDDKDEYIIDREKQFDLKRKILSKIIR